MCDPVAVEKMVNVVAAMRKIDYMFNNAGMIMFGEFGDMSYVQ